MENLRTVLVGVDYSDPSDNALREAARIARWDGARMVVLHVLDDRVLERARKEIALTDRLLADAEGRLRRHVEETVGSGSAELVCEFIIGHPFEELMAMAEKIAADLIVLGSHGIIRDEHYRLGTLATRCVRKAKTNVLIVRDWQDGPFKKVCTCVDFSTPSRHAAAAAVHIAQQDEAALDFLRIHQPIGALVGGTGFFVGEMPVYSPENDAAIVRMAEEKLGAFAEEVAGGCPHETHVYNETSLRGGIVEYLKNSTPDLVVLSARGHTSIRNMLIGSTAEKIIHGADCSTLVVKPDGFHYDLE
jgi:universal stress protein E